MRQSRVFYSTVWPTTLQSVRRTVSPSFAGGTSSCVGMTSSSSYLSAGTQTYATNDLIDMALAIREALWRQLFTPDRWQASSDNSA